MNKEQKTAVVEELSKELSDSDAVFAVDYRGISVPQAARLREGLRESETRFRVVKNRLTLRAADAAGTTSLKEYLEGPTALALVKGDAALAAKTISRLGSEWELLTYKGGLMEGEALDRDSFAAIARLPGRDALNAQAAGIIASPLTGLVRGLGSMVQGLAIQLQQIAEKGLLSADAPAPDPEEATGEEPPADADSSPEEEAEGKSEADPEPAESPEEASQEEVPEDVAKEGAEVVAEVVEQTGEGDAEVGSTQEEASEPDEAEEETSKDADKKEDE